MNSPNHGSVEVSHRVEEDGSSVENDVEMENVEESLASKFRKSSNKGHQVPKIFRDSISVLIPIDVRADLKIAVQRTRQKRIQSIYKQFPSLRKKEDKTAEGEGMAADEDDDEGDKAETNEKEEQAKKKTKSNVPTQVPLREQYGSVIDYLEAKYAKGVMLEDEDEKEIVDDGSGGQGSVYSGESFLDDTGLQLDVAEQVMANTTLTKLELEEDDADFFVNVGNLEVEGNDYGENYDPTQDKDSRTTKKRKKPSTTSSAAAGTKKKKVAPDTVSDKGKKSSSSTAATGGKASGDAKGALEPDEAASDPEVVAKAAKDLIDGMYKKMVSIIKKIKSEDLPRRKTTAKVSLVCPEDKKSGDSVTFTNPHAPDQRLRVQVPKDCAPGDNFKVTVPVKAPEDDGTDNNKFPTEFKDLVDDYARSYDDWCRAQVVIEPSFKVFKEKQAKFEKLSKEFPSTLVTKIDSDYLKKMVRRVRQYKIKKRKKALDQQQQVKEEQDAAPLPEEDEDSDDSQETPGVQRTINIPSAGIEFATVTFSAEDFENIADTA